MIKTVSVDIDHITTVQKDVAAIGFWLGSKSYNDFIPLLEKDKILAKIFRNALVFQIDSNGSWKVEDHEESDVDFFFEYSVFLSQTADMKGYQMVLVADGHLEDRDGNIVWKNHFLSEANPYSNEKVMYPLQTYYRNPIALKHAIGAASLQLSRDFIEDLGGTPYDPAFPIWEFSDKE